MPQLIGSIKTYPARATLGWYLGLIVLGAMALWHPWCQNAGDDGRLPVNLVDALFTSTSATCVTGLVVRSTPHDFSLLGQIVILVLIQVGGIGIMTVTTFIVFQTGNRGGLRQRALISATLGADSRADLGTILRNVLMISAICECTGFCILFTHHTLIMPWREAIWKAMFHSISAFCNAGFALYDDSLIRFRGDPVVNLTICMLIMIGGIGFPVVLDIKNNWKRKSWSDLWEHLQLHSKVMLIGSSALWMFGALCFAITEWQGALQGMGIGEGILVSLFQSVTARTAGFNTVDLAKLTDAMLFVLTVLMIIGAGACSTGGGFKVSTAATLVLRAWSTFHGHERVKLFRRTIPREAVERATATAMIFIVVAALALIMLLMAERSTELPDDTSPKFLAALFEVVSALGTVGLSIGLTPELTVPGRLIIVVLMVLGRLGPISVFAALSREVQDDPLTFPDEEPLVG